MRSRIIDKERCGDRGSLGLSRRRPHGGRRVARRGQRRRASADGGAARSAREPSQGRGAAARLRRRARGRQGRGSRRASRGSRRSSHAFAHPFRRLEQRRRGRDRRSRGRAREPSRASRDRARSRGAARRGRGLPRRAAAAQVRDVTVYFNPEDAALVRAQLPRERRAALQDRRATRALGRGDLRLASGSSLVDGTLAARCAEIVAAARSGAA